MRSKLYLIYGSIHITLLCYVVYPRSTQTSLDIARGLVLLV